MKPEAPRPRVKDPREIARQIARGQVPCNCGHPLCLGYRAPASKDERAEARARQRRRARK